MDSRVNEAVVFAHFHAKGELRRDTLQMIRALSDSGRKVVFVSTGINANAAAEAEQVCEVIVRENRGYDFYSWRAGLAHLGLLAGNGGTYDQVFLMNSSVLVFDASKLVEEFFNSRRDSDFFGLTASNEIEPHVQSYLIRIGSKMWRRKEFTDWWHSMVPVDDRQQVIFRYEIGLSKLVRSLGIRISASFGPHDMSKIGFFDRLYSLGWRRLVKSHGKINPTHFIWSDIFSKFGMVKIELIKSNPFKRDLLPLIRRAAADKQFAETLFSGCDS